MPDAPVTHMDAWQLCHELAVYHEDHIGQLTHLLERARPFRKASTREDMPVDPSSHSADRPASEDDPIPSLAQLKRNNLKMSEACLTVRDAATTFMRSRRQHDLDILEQAVGHLNHLPESLCPISFNIVARLDDAEQQLTTMRDALEQSTLALAAWLHQYASAFCEEAEVARHTTRIADHGGTLAYIATVTRANRQALTPFASKEAPQR